MVLLISYDLDGGDAGDAAAVDAAIAAEADGAVQVLPSQWLVESTGDPVDWEGYLLGAGVIGDNDSCLVVEVRPPIGGRLPEDVLDWLEDRGLFDD